MQRSIGSNGHATDGAARAGGGGAEGEERKEDTHFLTLDLLLELELPLESWNKRQQEKDSEKLRKICGCCHDKSPHPSLVQYPEL